MQSDKDAVQVWDPVVRIGHWAVVLAFSVAYFTEDDFLAQHVWAGYVVGAVLCVRLLWGFVGTRHARFKDFIRGPVATFRYLRDLLNRRAKRYVGHNPAGAVMIVVLLIGLSATVYSGLVLYAIEENAGPLAGLVSEQSFPDGTQTIFATAVAGENDYGDDVGHEEGSREEFWEELHELFANLTLVMVVVHVSGMLFTSHVNQENLIKAMFTGRKRRGVKKVS
ncbi:MAG: cytochrome b/b6 domain-containing protein [Gammaproteobacteria bacterium]|nr:cytochrome b/b6 domain-containing protein [Gammaproteobacteria bacterium]